MEGASRSGKVSQDARQRTKKDETLTMGLLHQLTEQESGPMARALFSLVGRLATAEAAAAHDADHMINK